MSDLSAANYACEIQAHPDRNLFSIEGGNRFLLLHVQAPAVPTAAHRPPLNLSFVLDRSGSMSGDKLAFVKQAAEYAIDLLDERDRTALVIYDDEVAILSPSVPITPSNRAMLHRLIQPVVTGGCTDLGAGWLTGCEQVASTLKTEALNRALLLTDGLANRGITDREELTHHAKELKKRGVTTTTIGVGADFDEHIMRALADAGGGHFYFIEHPRDIPSVFLSELNEMLTVVARDVALSLVFPQSATVEVLNNTYESFLVPGLVRISLGEMASGESRDIALCLMFPKTQLGTPFEVTAALGYTAADTQLPRTAGDVKIVFTSASQEQDTAESADTLVLEQVLKQASANAKLKIIDALSRGDADRARALARESSEFIARDLAQAQAPDESFRIENFSASYSSASTIEKKQMQNTNYRTNRSRQ